VTELEVLQRASEELIDELVGAQREQGSGVLELEYRAFPSDAPPTTQRVQLSRPSTDVALLFGLLSTKLESLQMGFGIERISLEATNVAQLEEHQGAYWSSSKRNSAGHASELIDVLASRLKPHELLECQAREAHLPEAAFARVPFLEVGASRQEVGSQRVICSERPSLLFEAPERIELVRARDGRAARLRLARETVDVERLSGPERITGPWWDPRSAGVRDYYRALTSDGRSFWIFQEPSSRRWFLHGEWS